MSQARRAVALLWAVAIAVVLIHGALTAHVGQGKSHTVIATYFGAGLNWIHGMPLYNGGRGFVYSPLAAALFAPFAVLPSALGNVLWLALAVGAFLAAFRGAISERFFLVEPKRAPWAFLGLLPLALGNFSNGQVNPVVCALLLFSLVALQRGWFWVAAVAAALTVYLKIYPLVFGLALAALWPRHFSWRFLAVLVLLVGLSFLLQRPAYVWSQYQLWFETRAADNRSLYEINIAPRDLRMLLRALHLTPPAPGYAVLQVGSGAAIGLFLLAARFRWRWSTERVLAAVFCLTVCWMLLCGPSTESATYVLLAPAVACAVAESFGGSGASPRKVLAWSSYAVLLSALFINSFLHLKKNVYVMSIQPLGALLFGLFSVVWFRADALWISENSEAAVGSPNGE